MDYPYVVKTPATIRRETSGWLIAEPDSNLVAWLESMKILDYITSESYDENANLNAEFRFHNGTDAMIFKLSLDEQWPSLLRHPAHS